MKEQIKERRPHGRGFAIVLCVAMACLLVAANLAVSLIPFAFRTVEVASMGATHLSDHSVKFLRSLDKDVTIYLVSENGDSVPVIDLLLGRYTLVSEGHVTVERVDPAKDTEFTEEYGELSSMSMVVTCEATDRYRIIGLADLYCYVNDFISYYLNMISGASDTSKAWVLSYSELQYYAQGLSNQGVSLDSSSTVEFFAAETRLTSAIDYVTNATVPSVYVLEGHGGRGLPATWVEVMGLKSLNLGGEAQVPADMTCLVIYDPVTDLTEGETAKIKAFAEAGGGVLLSTRPGCESFENLMSLCAVYGLTAETGTVNDPSYNMGDAAALIPTPNTANPICEAGISAKGTDASGQQQVPMVFMTNTHAIVLPEEGKGPENVGYSRLFVTSDQAVTVTSDESKSPLGEAAKRCVAVTAVKRTTASDAIGDGYITWFGSADVFTDAVSETTKGDNLLYMAAAINYMSDEFDSMYEGLAPVNMSVDVMEGAETADVVLWGITLVVVIPLGLLTVGLVVWLKRRRR